jgi:hypothetical protein
MTAWGEAMTWHVDQDLFNAYEGGRLDPSRVLAVDAHLQGCPSCRGAVPIDMVWLDRSWAAVLDTVHAPAPGPVRRTLQRMGLPEHRVRLLAATPALRWSWLAAVASVLTFAVVAAYTGDAGARTTLLLFLIFAPILPVLAVATAYGPPVDPMHEITAATSTAGPALVLWRATAVVGVSLAMGAVAAALLPGPGWYAAAWLLPALVLCVSSLALATVVPLPLAAGLLGAVWLTGIGAVAVGGGVVQTVAFGPAAQAGYLLAAATAAAVLTARRRRLDPGESH